MDLIMHRVTKESGLTDSANGSMAKDTEPLGSTTKGGRHVGLDKMCLLMEVHLENSRFMLFAASIICQTASASEDLCRGLACQPLFCAVPGSWSTSKRRKRIYQPIQPRTSPCRLSPGNNAK